MDFIKCLMLCGKLIEDETSKGAPTELKILREEVGYARASPPPHGSWCMLRSMVHASKSVNRKRSLHMCPAAQLKGSG